MNKKSHKNPQDQEVSIGYMKKDEQIATVYIGNMIYAKDEKDVLHLFKKYGYVSYVRINRDRRTNRSKGFGFVQIESLSHAQEAIKNLNGRELDGRTLKVSLAIESQPNKAPARTRNRTFSKRRRA